MEQTKALSRRQLLAAAGGGAIFCWTAQSASDVATAAAQELAPQSVHLHWWRPTYYLQEKTVPPACILSTRVVLGEDLSITLGNGSPALRGRIEVRGKRYHAQLQGQFASSTNLVDAEVELEKPFEGGYLVASGIEWGTRFALSTDPKCDYFLKPPLSSGKKD